MFWLGLLGSMNRFETIERLYTAPEWPRGG